MDSRFDPLVAAVFADARMRRESVTLERTRTVIAAYFDDHPDEDFGLVNPAVVFDQVQARLHRR
jgi:hypothetical protein